MLDVKELTIKVNDRYLVKNLSFTLNKKDKLAIIGEEGNGKSTLLKSILGICTYASINGIINKKGNRIGYLEQSISKDSLSKKVYDYLFTSDEDYYNKINNLYKYLEIINLDDSILEQYINTLSGGEKVKINILKLLLEEYDIYFLDEPTNDLDIETLEWLEKFINNCEKPIIYVSHDETLLSNTANCILHLEQIKKKQDCRHTFIKTDYDTYIETRLRSIEHQNQVSKNEKREYNKQQAKLNKIMNKVEHQQNTISRSDPHGARLLKKKMHSIKSQEKKLESRELTETVDVEEGINFFFNDVYIPKNKIILNLDIPELKIKDKILSKNIKLDIIGNTHLCIIGYNGVGKSTLIKLIYSKLKDRTDIKVGYMPQNYEDILADYEYVLDFISHSKSKEDITISRTYLGNMKFTHEETTGKIKDLSNGTKAKLILVKLVLDNCNVLILDEPTRNVSPLSNPVIRKVLKDFQGTIISISHDRKYISEVANEVYELTSEGIFESNILKAN
ncbi:MAG TPA: ABC transporter ATP-binding protein [Firmicutes bacterium]|nr:ABC transporter ATP-binding protein [Bacillota bacterium]